MPTRREMLLGASALCLSGPLFACSRGRKVTDALRAGVELKVLVPKDRDPSYPLVVALHGRGGAPEHWIDGWRPFPGRAEIALPRGFSPHEDGFAWFSWTTDMKDDKLAADASAAEERLWKGIVELAAGRRVVVAGYDQGALLSYVIAARHPDVVAGAFPVAGACPEALFPKTRAAPLVAFHGTSDDVFAIDAARASVEAFKRQGGASELREYAGVGHSPTDELHEDLRAAMLRTLGP